MNRVRRKARSIAQNLGIIGEFLGFLWKRKIWWMIPLFLTLVLIGGLLIFAESSALSPFVYTLI